MQRLDTENIMDKAEFLSCRQSFMTVSRKGTDEHATAETPTNSPLMLNAGPCADVSICKHENTYIEPPKTTVNDSETLCAASLPHQMSAQGLLGVGLQFS